MIYGHKLRVVNLLPYMVLVRLTNCHRTIERLELGIQSSCSENTVWQEYNDIVVKIKMDKGKYPNK